LEGRKRREPPNSPAANSPGKENRGSPLMDGGVDVNRNDGDRRHRGLSALLGAGRKKAYRSQARWISSNDKTEKFFGGANNLT